MQAKLDTPRHYAQNGSLWAWFGPLVYMLLLGLYSIMRYAGRWAENDSAVFTDVIRVFVSEGRLVPQAGDVYNNGFAYQSISAFIIAVTGLDVATLQQLVYPLLACLVVLPAWLLYRDLTGSVRGATIAAILLFTQPEFLFVILRSSHEKWTRLFMLLCLFWLVRSFRLWQRPWLFAKHVALFYLTCFAFIASNNLLAHSFIFALAIALGIGVVLARRSPIKRTGDQPIVQRFWYATLVCLGLSYLFTFYLYLPAQHDLLVLRGLWDRIAALFLDVQTESTTVAYQQVEAGWSSLWVYFVLSSANWLLLIASFGIWLRQGYRWLWQRRGDATPEAWLLWLLYTAFAAQGALSIAADLSGAIGSNLQHRIYPSFSIIAVGLVASALAGWHRPQFSFAIRLGLTATVFWIAIASVVKATNDPLVSNVWTFYRGSEIDALRWSDQHLRHARICTDFNERLTTAYLTVEGHSQRGNTLDWYQRDQANCNTLITDVSRLRSARFARPIPYEYDSMQVYDNGEAQLYHPRPRTPYQR